LDGRRRPGIVEDCEEGFQGAVAEMVEVVTAGEDEFGAGAVEGDDEGLGGLHPAVDGNAMDAVGFSGIGEGGTGGQGVGDALLDAGEGRVVGCVSHSDDENSMGLFAGPGISEVVYFVFMGMRGCLGLSQVRGALRDWRAGKSAAGYQPAPQSSIAATKEAA
jgi:hypothetical protein